MRLSFFLLINVLTLSCSTNNAKSNTATNKKKIDSLTQNVKFNFSAKYVTDYNNLTDADTLFKLMNQLMSRNSKNLPPHNFFQVHASLFNNNADTIYFLTSTCNGCQDFLKYDSTKFELSPLYMCNASFVVIKKIAPKSEYDFNGYFTSKEMETKINLCLDFYRVDKSFSIKNMHVSNLYRERNKQNLICAEGKILQK